jgi:hypothetical protein
MMPMYVYLGLLGGAESGGSTWIMKQGRDLIWFRKNKLNVVFDKRFKTEKTEPHILTSKNIRHS